MQRVDIATPYATYKHQYTKLRAYGPHLSSSSIGQRVLVPFIGLKNEIGWSW